MKIDNKKILILYGGWSDERSISLESGKSVYESLKNEGLNVFLFDFNIDDPSLLEKFVHKNNIDIVFNLIHGVGGEDGHVQGYLEKIPVKTVGSDSSSSCKSFNKILTKETWKANNLPTPDYYKINSNIFEGNIMNNLGDKFVIKPIKSGSSVGIKILNKKDFILDNHKISYEKLCSMMNKNISPEEYFIEEYIDYAEYTAPIIGETVFPIIKIETAREFYNYDAKYLDDDTLFTFPEFPKNIQQKINEMTLVAFKSVGCTMWGRVDFFMNDKYDIKLIEINSIPGMTSHSLVPMSAKKLGLSYIDLVSLILRC